MNIPTDLDKHYRAFFTKNEAGIYFMAELDRLIEDNHKQAEDKPELSRDYVQRAKGVREIQDHIRSVAIERSSLK